METLSEIATLLSACGDLSLHLTAGDVYPTLTIRQGVGFVRCLSLIEQVGSMGLAIAPPLLIAHYGRRVLVQNRIRRRRRDVRTAHLASHSRM
ncbi:MAG: hypothetical protein AAFY65_05875 [Pseudomonadota bacterium]